MNFFFSHHAEFFCFWFKNGLLVKKGVWKSRYCWKKKEKAQNFSPTYQKLREKKRNISWLWTRKWKFGIWCTTRYNFNFRKLCPSLHRDQQWRLSLAWHSCWFFPSFCSLCLYCSQTYASHSLNWFMLTKPSTFFRGIKKAN